YRLGGRCESLQAVQDEVEPERELEVVVAAAQAAVVGRRGGQLADVRVGHGQRLRDRRDRRRVSADVAGVVERVLGEAEDAAPETLQRVLGNADQKAGRLEEPQDTVDVAQG